jgi:hypothetical protein
MPCRASGDLRPASGLSLSEGGGLPSLGKDTDKTVESSNGLLKAGCRSFDPQSSRNQESLPWEQIKGQNIVFSMNYGSNGQAWPGLPF